MAKTLKRQTGDIGEDVAYKYLINKGFSIIERNYLRPWGEIDIIAKRDGMLHFVEVKTVTREPGSGYRPEDNVHKSKLNRLNRTIQTYLLNKNVSRDTLWQIDLVCVYLNFKSRKAKVEVLENIIL